MTVNAVPRSAPAARPRRTVPALAAAVALALALTLPGTAFAWDAGSFSPADEQLLVTLTNQARAAAGLPALKVDPALAEMARWRSKDMIDRDYFSHSIPPDGKKVFDHLTASGYCFKVAGENLGTNNFPDDVATETIQGGFMDSAGHRANILGPSWEVIGVGAYEGADGKHMWTVLFSDPCTAATPAPTATPKPTATPTPAPTTAPTAAPTVAATTAPTEAPAVTPGPTPSPTRGPTPGPEPTPFPTPSPIGGPASPGPASAALVSTPTPPSATDSTVPAVPATPSGPAPGSAGTAGSGSLRIFDPPFAAGLVETIVSDVAGGYFGG